MALICITPVLGFTPETFVSGDAIPYWTGMDSGVSPQIGSVVSVLDDETDTTADYVLSDTGWAVVV